MALALKRKAGLRPPSSLRGLSALPSPTCSSKPVSVGARSTATSAPCASDEAEATKKNITAKPLN